MRIASVRHRGLSRLIKRDDRSGLPPEVVGKVRKIILFLQAMRAEEQLVALQQWRAHRLAGPRAGTWSITVTRNWRLTFRIEAGEIVERDYEDHH